MEIYNDHGMIIEECTSQKGMVDLCVNDTLNLKIIRDGDTNNYKVVILKYRIGDVDVETTDDLEEYEMKGVK